jgi:glycosyltransferase involved in cell wall biosynthesis
MDRPLIALCVMVKNEEKTLPRLLASVRGFVDRVIALDTGSTDNTLWLLKAAEAQFEYGVDILEIPFHDFGRSRTQLMQFAKGKADWLLLMDADQTLKFHEDVDCATCPTTAEIPELFREQLPFVAPEIKAFSLKHIGTHPYWVPRLVRGDMDWRFVGSTHEYLDQSHTAEKLPDIEIVHHADGGTRGREVRT